MSRFFDSRHALLPVPRVATPPHASSSERSLTRRRERLSGLFKVRPSRPPPPRPLPPRRFLGRSFPALGSILLRLALPPPDPFVPLRLARALVPPRSSIAERSPLRAPRRSVLRRRSRERWQNARLPQRGSHRAHDDARRRVQHRLGPLRVRHLQERQSPRHGRARDSSLRRHRQGVREAHAERLPLVHLLAGEASGDESRLRPRRPRDDQA